MWHKDLVDEICEIAPSSDYKKDSELNTIIYKALRYALNREGDTRDLINIDGTINYILDKNSIAYREIRYPSNIESECSTSLIVFDIANNIPYVIFRDWGRIWIHNPINGLTSQLRRSKLNFENIAYEIYPQLPTSIKNPFDLMIFAFKGNYSLLVNVLITSLIVAGFNLATPILTNFLVGSILPKSDIALLVETSFVVIVLTLLSCFYQYYNSIALISAESIINIRMEVALWNHALKLPMGFLNKYGPNDLISRVMGIRQIRQLISNGLLTAFIGTTFALTNLYLMNIYFPELVAPSLLVSGSIMLISLIFIILSIRIEKPYQAQEAQLGDMSLQNVIAMPQIRIFGVEPFVMHRWLNKVRSLSRLMVLSNIYDDIIEILASILSPVASVILFVILVGKLGNANETPQNITSVDRLATLSFNQIVASFVAYQSAFFALNSQLSILLNTISRNLSQLIVHWQRSSELLFADPEIDVDNGSIIEDLKGDYLIAGLKYSFPGASNAILQDINLTIESEKFTAITGPSGCGKTTLIRIVLGLIKADYGSITVDRIDLDKIALRQYRRQIGVVLQNSPLPTGTIYDIVRAGRNVSRNDVLDCLKLASFDNDLSSMPMGLDTIITEGASGISGGQKQRLVIARALLGKPKVLIFDEATSALDNKTQAEITAVLNNLNITRIVIAHRISTIYDADKIIVLKNGLVAETGTYSELSKNPNSYLFDSGFNSLND